MSIELRKITEYPIKELYISHSTMEMADSCMRKLEFSKLFGFNLKTRSTASDGGNAIHRALGVYILTKNKEEAILKLLLEYPIDLCSNPLWNWSLEAAYGALLSLIYYFEEHTEIEIAFINEKPAIEVPFLINIIHNIDGLMPVKYRGYIDFVFYNRLHDYYFVCDLKNTSFKINDFTPMYKYSPQCIPYSLVLARAMGKNFDTLNIEYLIAKADLFAPQVINLQFQKTKSDVEEWTRDLYFKLLSIKSFIETKWFPRKSGSCISFSRQCKFFELCASRNIQTINLMLDGMKQTEEQEFIPQITLDLEIV